jgi:uncharacterized phage-like protein YoqJ
MEKPACAFTGHDLSLMDYGYNEEEPLCVMTKQAMKSQMLALYDSGVNTFYSDCELGVGLWGAELALELMGEHPDIELICVIPYEEQPRRWHECFRDRYYTVLEKSTYNELISTQLTDKSYRQCGKFLVDHAEHLIAVCENDKVVCMEIAAYTVAYAKRKGRQIIYINPETAEITV